MKRSLLFASALFLFAIFVSSCTTGGSFISQNLTSVELSEPNYNIVAKNVEGSSEASYVIGVTYSAGSIANTMAVARVSGTAKLYDDAIKSLWKNFEAEYGSADGRKLALANVRIDNDMLNLFLYTETKMFITADIVEFIDD